MSRAERMSPNDRRVKYIEAPGRIYGPSRELTNAQYRRLVKKSNGTVERVKIGKRFQAVAKSLASIYRSDASVI